MNAEKLCTLVFLVPVLICFALGVIVAATTARRKREEEEVRAARAERVKAFRAAQKTVERAALQVKAAEAPKAPIGRPRKNPEPAQEAPAEDKPAPEDKRTEAVFDLARLTHGNNAFAGHRVAFTGKLPNMTRAEAIATVVANGGKAYDKTMPVGTTLLVVGDNKGKNTGKLDKADRWIGQVRKITPAQFDEMLKQPPTLTPNEFAAMLAAQ